MSFRLSQQQVKNGSHIFQEKDNVLKFIFVCQQQYPLSKLIGSTQTCNYKFDNQKKHMTSATCTEKHIFLPFSYQ